MTNDVKNYMDWQREDSPSGSSLWTMYERHLQCYLFLKEIERQVNSHNVMCLRGSPGVVNPALATSIAARLRNKNRHLIPLQSDRNQPVIVTTDALWRTVTCGLACLNPSVRQHVQRLWDITWGMCSTPSWSIQLSSWFAHSLDVQVPPEAIPWSRCLVINEPYQVQPRVCASIVCFISVLILIGPRRRLKYHHQGDLHASVVRCEVSWPVPRVIDPRSSSQISYAFQQLTRQQMHQPKTLSGSKAFNFLVALSTVYNNSWAIDWSK